MKVYNIITFVTTILLSSCINEVLSSSEPQTQSIMGTMEEIDTKTNVMDYGTFTWSEGDKIWIQTADNGISGTLASGAGTSDAI